MKVDVPVLVSHLEFDEGFRSTFILQQEIFKLIWLWVVEHISNIDIDCEFMNENKHDCVSMAQRSFG
jgi:hypothetical protein